MATAFERLHVVLGGRAEATGWLMGRRKVDSGSSTVLQQHWVAPTGIGSHSWRDGQSCLLSASVDGRALRLQRSRASLSFDGRLGGRGRTLKIEGLSEDPSSFVHVYQGVAAPCLALAGPGSMPAMGTPPSPATVRTARGQASEESAGSAVNGSGAVSTSTSSVCIPWHDSQVLHPDGLMKQHQKEEEEWRFSSITDAIESLQQGKFVVVVDDEDRENEGDLIMAGSMVTEEAMAFLVRHTSGVVCVSMTGWDLDRLQIPLMVPEAANQESKGTSFTVTVDLSTGISTGISASDRAKTIRALASPASSWRDFRRPGHIFPLRYRDGGVLVRAGHTEAAVDLAKLAGLPPIGVLCELVNDDGTMARVPQLRVFARKYGLDFITIAELIKYRERLLSPEQQEEGLGRKCDEEDEDDVEDGYEDQLERELERTAVARLPTQWGSFQAYSYLSKRDGIEHVAMVKGDIGDGCQVLVRVHSECLTGDIFQSARCDCGYQLAKAMEEISEKGRGVMIYLKGQEGRGIGLGHKLQAYNLQDEGRDTVDANMDLGLPVDQREYSMAALILRDLGVKSVVLMTNNPDKYTGLIQLGVGISRRVPVVSPVTKENQRYLETKRSRMGHIYGSDPPGTIFGSLER